MKTKKLPLSIKSSSLFTESGHFYGHTEITYIFPPANVALDRPTWQSGLDWILTSDLAVDGDPDPDLENKHCACTSWPRFNTSKCMETGWWMVDLGSPVEIEEVVLVGSYENSEGTFSTLVEEFIRPTSTLCSEERRGKNPVYARAL